MATLNGFGIEMLALWGLSVLGVLYIADLIARYATRRRRGWYGGNRSTTGGARARFEVYDGSSVLRANDVADARDQLRFVAAADFKVRRVMNLSEYKVFKIVEEEVGAGWGGYRVFAQTSLGEVLSTKDQDTLAFRSINSKRVDCLVIDRRGYPIVAIEYQGKGHYQGNAALRDEVKKQALVKAGVEYVEIFPSHGGDHIRSAVREALRRTSRARAVRSA